MVFGMILLTGMVFIIIKTLNMLLGKEIGIYRSNIINHIGGALGSTVLLIVFMGTVTFTWSKFDGVGIYPLIGGIVGACFVALSNYTFSKTKVFISTLLILLGQSIVALYIDYIYFGTVVSSTQLIGSLMIVASVILYNSEEIDFGKIGTEIKVRLLAGTGSKLSKVQKETP